jgi:hypothetical protein
METAPDSGSAHGGAADSVASEAKPLGAEPASQRALNTERLKRVLLAVPEIALRVDWLRDWLEHSTGLEVARVLNGLCQQSECSVTAAREAMLSCALLFVRLRDSPRLDQLREQANREHLLSLDRLLRRAPEPLPLEVECSSPPVPDYGAGRELTVGERRSLARRSHRASLERLLYDPHPLVIRQLLGNPKLVEGDVMRLLTRRPVRPEIVTEIAHTTWFSRPRLRMAVLLNPGSPPAIAVPLLSLCTRPELKEVLDSADVSKVLRATARELFQLRPPLRVTREETGVQ